MDKDKMIPYKEFADAVIRVYGVRVSSLMFGEMMFPHRKRGYLDSFSMGELEEKLDKAIFLDQNGIS